MMPIDKILQLLSNSGFRGPGGGPVVANGQFLLLEDPTCITRSVSDFIHFAWIAITIVTAFMFLGWAIAIIRSGKIGGIANNMRNLFLIFGILSAAVPIGNAIYGGDLFGAGCRTISVKIDDVQKILAAADSKLKTANPDAISEEFDITDTGPSAQSAAEAGATADQSAPGFVDVNGNVYETEAGAQSPIEQMPASAVSGPGGTSAMAQGRSVIYTGADGVRRIRTGDRGFRNHNPGNMEYGATARSMGAIGTDGRYAIFPDDETGRRAQKSLLTSGKYANLTIAKAVEKWAPPSENDVAAYQRALQKWTGIPVTARISELNPAQLDALADAMARMEGNHGTEQVLK